MKSDSAEKRCRHFNTYHSKKGFTLIELFIVLSILAVVGAVSVSYFHDYIEDAKMSVRNTNVKLVNEALARYYKEHTYYPKYIWRNDSVDDIKHNVNKGLDTVLSSYFANKTVSEILSEASDSKGYEIYYRVTKPRKINRVTNDENINVDNSFDTGTWKRARNLRVETFDYLVNEIKVVDLDIPTTTFDNLEKFNFPLIHDSEPISNDSSRYNTIAKDDVLDIKMICCPPGTFLMGAPMDEVGRKTNETPHNVTLTKQFLISKYEITQKQYLKVMGTNPSNNKKNEDNPVENMTRDNALEFCERLNTNFSRLVPYGYKFDLPTEAQWEYACRAGTTKALNNNKDCVTTDNYANIREVAWFNNNSNFSTDDNKKQTHPVGQKMANNWGLYDMHGNVEELIKDVRPSNYPPYPLEDAIDPLVTVGNQRCHRGGSFESTYDRCRSASRQGSALNSASKNVGFRVVLVSTGE